jgi:hypothetical protein
MSLSSNGPDCHLLHLEYVHRIDQEQRGESQVTGLSYVWLARVRGTLFWPRSSLQGRTSH